MIVFSASLVMLVFFSSWVLCCAQECSLCPCLCRWRGILVKLYAIWLDVLCIVWATNVVSRCDASSIVGHQPTNNDLPFVIPTAYHRSHSHYSHQEPGWIPGDCCPLKMTASVVLAFHLLRIYVATGWLLISSLCFYVVLRIYVADSIIFFLCLMYSTKMMTRRISKEMRLLWPRKTMNWRYLPKHSCITHKRMAV
jgi:hypothetical protein